MSDAEYEKRVQHCEDCVLTKGCTRKTIYAVDGYCWADKLYKENGVTKLELAQRHELLED